MIHTSWFKRIYLKTRSDTYYIFYLGFGFLLCFCLYQFKLQEQIPYLEPTLLSEIQAQAIPLESIKIEVNGQSISLAVAPITNQDFYKFAADTQFISKREQAQIFPNYLFKDKQQITPNYITHPQDPVQWISFSEAKLFCIWFAHQLYQTTTYEHNAEGLHIASFIELHTANELFPHLFSTSQLEWTNSTLYNFDANPSSKKYISSFKAKEKAIHRMDREVNFSSFEPRAFRLAWSPSLDKKETIP